MSGSGNVLEKQRTALQESGYGPARRADAGGGPGCKISIIPRGQAVGVSSWARCRHSKPLMRSATVRDGQAHRADLDAVAASASVGISRPSPSPSAITPRI
jgi:hypothetical protein